jgi:hypothetical protein
MGVRFSVVVVVAIGAGVATRASDLPLRLTASSQSTGIAAGIGRDVEITITRWSTEPERQALAAAFVKLGMFRVLDVLQNAPNVGRIRLTNRPGYDLRFAARCPLPDGGQRLILMTDRPMVHWVTWSQVQMSNYPFALVEVRLDKNGAGIAKHSLTTNLMFDDRDRVVALDRYAGTQVWLQNVSVETRN